MSYWKYFRNIHQDCFERWWEKNKNLLVNGLVLDLRDPETIEFLYPYDIASRRFRKYGLDHFPTTKEMLGSITINREYIFVAIPLRKLTLAEIGKQIGQIRKKQKEKYLKEPRSLSEINIKLKGRIEIEELDRYLKFYMLRKEKIDRKMTENEIIKIMEQEILKKNPESSKSRDEIQRIISADVERAKNIIKNIEQGQFPGTYQP